MSRKTKGMNRRQKVAHKKGEQRVGRDEILELLKMSCSEDPQERVVAAELLCPCHVRRRIEPVWEALYRMLEDPDVKVRRAAWHTLEDGGRPDDPALDVIMERVLRNEKDPGVRNLVEHVAGPRRERDLAMARVATIPRKKTRGRCDFCGESDIFVEWDIQTTIPSAEGGRLAMICETCAVTV